MLVKSTKQILLLESELRVGRHMLKPAAAAHVKMGTHGLDPVFRGFQHFHQIRPVALSSTIARPADYALAGERSLDQHGPTVDVDDPAAGVVQSFHRGHHRRARRTTRHRLDAIGAQLDRPSAQAVRNSAMWGRPSSSSATRKRSHSPS